MSVVLLFYFISWLERWVVKVGELIIVECFAFAFVPPREKGLCCPKGKKRHQNPQATSWEVFANEPGRGYGLHTHNETNEKEL